MTTVEQVYQHIMEHQLLADLYKAVMDLKDYPKFQIGNTDSHAMACKFEELLKNPK